MFRLLICLLSFLTVFTKYGEPIAKFMSIHGDINLAMFERAVDANEIIGFVYEDRDGAFVLQSTFCKRTTKGNKAFMAQKDCSVEAKVTDTESPDTHRIFYRRHESNFPERNTGSNLLIGKRDENSHITKVVSYGTTIIQLTRRRSSSAKLEILCNDKSGKALNNLFYLKDDGHLAFNSNTPTEYEQTMKCLAIYKTRGLKIGKLFTLIIENLEERPFTFQANSYVRGTTAALYYPIGLPYAIDQSDITKPYSSMLSFQFVADHSTGCPPKLNASPTNEYRPLNVVHNGSSYTMPPIRSGISSTCGVATVPLRSNREGQLKYWCECNQGNVE